MPRLQVNTKALMALSVFSILVALEGCQSQRRVFSEQDAVALRAVFDSTVLRLKAGNLVAWSQEFASDARFYAPNTPPVIGRAAILAWGQANPPFERFAFANAQVQGDGDLAWGTSDYSLKMKGLPADSGKQLVVYKRNASGAWEVIAGAFNSNVALPQPSAVRH